jgi:hypothetical protein
LFIPITAHSGNDEVRVSVKNIETEPGRDISIPLTIEMNDIADTALAYSFDMAYRWDILDIQSIANATITSRTRDSLTETLTVSGIFPVATAVATLHCNAFTTIGCDIASPVVVNNFEITLNCPVATITNGEVKLIGCALDNRVLVFFTPTDLDVSNDESAIKCLITTEEDCSFELNIFSASGEKVYSTQWHKPNSQLDRREIMIGIEPFASGCYIVALKSKYYYISRKVLIVK